MYSKLFRTIAEPLWEGGIKRRNVRKYEKTLNRTQWLPREEIEQLQWKALRELLLHCEKQSAYWQGIFRALGISAADIHSYSDFLSLPVLTKDEIRAHRSEMIARDHKGKTWEKSTGGSTGQPLIFDYTKDSYDWRNAVTRRGYGWTGCRGGVKQAYIWGVTLGDIPILKRWKETLHQTILRQKYFNCFNFGEREMEACRRELIRFQPQVIVGYTNPLYNFAKLLNSRSDAAAIRPSSVINAAEKLHEYQREEIEKAFQAPVFNTYGSREFMLIAMECEQHDGLHISSENLFVEILRDDGTPVDVGEEGRVVITDLHNYGMPFVRYEIGDLAVRTDRECACGRGLPLMGSITGRSLDMIRLKDGKMIPGEFFPHLMKDYASVRKFQVVQENLNTVVVKIVKSSDFRNDDIESIKKLVRETLGNEMSIEYQFVEDIPLTRSGKHRVTISKLGDME